MVPRTALCRGTGGVAACSAMTPRSSGRTPGTAAAGVGRLRWVPRTGSGTGAPSARRCRFWLGFGFCFWFCFWSWLCSWLGIWLVFRIGFWPGLWLWLWPGA